MTTIPNLPNATSLTGNELMLVEQDGVTKNVRAGVLASLANVDGRKVVANITAGLAATTSGQEFAIACTFGPGAYVFLNSSGAALFQYMTLRGERAQSILAARAMRQLPSLVPQLPPGIILNAWGLLSQEWDGRVLINGQTQTPPTLNLLPDPFGIQDEDGNATPARTVNDSTVDPNGGNNAVRLAFTAALQTLYYWRAVDEDLPVDDYRVGAAGFKLISGGSSFRAGSPNSAGNYLTFTADGTWTPQSFLVTGYDNASKNFDLGLTSNTGNLDGVMAVYGAQFYDSFAGAVLPTGAQELAAAQAGHGKRATAFRGSILYAADCSVNQAADLDGILFNLYLVPQALTEATLIIWQSPTALPAGSYGNAMSFDFHDSTNSSGKGLIGVAATTGYPYIVPTLNSMSGKVAFNMVGQGMTSYILTLKNGQIIPYINGIPCYEAGDSWSMAVMQRLIAGAYNGLNKRRKILNGFPGYLDGPGFAARALTETEVSQVDAHGRAMLRLSGNKPGLRKAAVFGLCDSMTAFGESYFWHLGADTTLSPHAHCFIEAVGGSALANWQARKAFLKRQIAAAARAGYEEILLFCLAGANEYLRWQDDGSAAVPNYAPWKAEYLSYLAELKAIAPTKVKIVGLPMLPRAGAGGLPYSSNSLAVDTTRIAWNADLVTNHVAMGIDYVIDWRSDTRMSQYANSAAAIAVWSTGDNPSLNVTDYQGGGTHVTDVGGDYLEATHVRPWFAAHQAGLSGEV